MQSIYYIENSGSLSLITDLGDVTQWSNIDALTISNARQQIIAESSSVEIVVFPIDGTNIYYSTDAVNNIPIVVDTGSYTTITSYFSTTNVAAPELVSCSFYISSSTVSISGSTNPATLLFSPLANSVYTFRVTGSGSYDSYLYVGDTTIDSATPEIGYGLVNKSGSNVGVSASVYLSASHNYNVYMTIIGSFAP